MRWARVFVVRIVIVPFALGLIKEPVLLPTVGYPHVTDRDYMLNEQLNMSDTFQSDRSARLGLAYQSPAELKLKEEEKQKQEKVDKELERQKDEARKQEKAVENKRKAGMFKWFREIYYNMMNRFDGFRLNNRKNLGLQPA